MNPLRSTTITLGITGSVAAVKTPDLIKKIKSEEIEVNIVLTENAEKFISIPLLKKLSKKVYLKERKNDFYHINLARKSDLIIIAPITANTISKLACGFGDNLLTSLVLTAKCPIILCPAMNTRMWTNPIIKQNLKRLLSFPNFFVVPPDKGPLACGETGEGRLADINKITEKTKKLLSEKDFSDKKILIISGATKEYIDPIRFITNESSGKMGKALNEESQLRGGETKILTASGCTKKLFKEASRLWKSFDIIISCAAPCDFTPSKYAKNKIKKKKKILLPLKKTPDILSFFGKNKRKNQILVGFSLESSNLIKNSKTKLKEKNLDLIVANPIKSIKSDKSRAILISKTKVKKLPLMQKKELAKKIFNEIKNLLLKS